MRAYTVHARPGDERPETLVFIKDGFSWPALIFSAGWLVWHRMWLALMGFVIVWLLLAWTGRLASEDLATALGLLGTVYFALEANNIRRWSLAQRGWQDIGAAHGDTLEEAEIGFFERRRVATESGANQADRRPAQAKPDSGSDHITHDGPIFGLFPEPER